MTTRIRHPVEWGVDHLKEASIGVKAAASAMQHVDHTLAGPLPTIRRIGIADIWDALARGFADFGEYRTDVIFFCAFYPVAGLILAELTSGYGMWQMLFPLVSGFALIGPPAAVGLYEMSRRREQGHSVSWATAFGVVGSRSFAPVEMLGLVLLPIFLIWLLVAYGLYEITLGPDRPASFGALVHAVFATPAGWLLIAAGDGIGFLFALLVFSISVISFPMLIDRNVAPETAIFASVRAVALNPGPMAVWGLIVAGGLAIGSIPLLLGLIVVFPVLGHATWHLYRKIVPQENRAQTIGSHEQ